MQNLNGSIVGGNVTLNKAGITGLSGAATTVSTAAGGGATSLIFVNQGKAYQKANLSGAATPTNDASTPTAVAATAATGSAFRALTATGNGTSIVSGSACCFVFGYDALGNLRVAQGPIVSYTDTSANSTVTPFPSVPDWMTPFAYAVIKFTNTANSTLTWTFGTSNWNATGIVIDTPVDVMSLPAVPPITA